MLLINDVDLNDKYSENSILRDTNEDVFPVMKIMHQT